MLAITLLVMIGGVAVMTLPAGSGPAAARGHISVGPAGCRRRCDRGCCVRPKVQKEDRGEVRRTWLHRGLLLQSVSRRLFGSLAVAGWHDPNTRRGYGGITAAS